MTDRPILRVIIYDIADDRRRCRIAKVLEERAVRVQESAFEARLSSRQLDGLMNRLTRLATAEDSLRAYTVPENALARCRVHGGGPIADGARFWLL
jgi:CRISPR-associated protein Cas2